MAIIDLLLKFAKITGIDCGARQTSWVEASIQLPHGGGRTHMVASKFNNILEQSRKHIRGLDQAELRIEFAHDNDGLQYFEIQTPHIMNGGVEVLLPPGKLFANRLKIAVLNAVPNSIRRGN